MLNLVGQPPLSTQLYTFQKMGHPAVKLKNLVVIAIIGAGVAYGGVKGYIHYQVKKQVDQLVAAARLFADIEYASISSDLQGQIMINGLVVYPRGVNEAVKTEQLTVITPGLGYLLTGSDDAKRGKLPERMGFALTGVHLNLRGALVEMLEQAEAAQLGQQQPEDIACSLSGNFLTAQYRELGVDELVFDTRFSFERGPGMSQLVFKMDYSIRDLEQAEIEVTLEGVGNSPMNPAFFNPQLKRVTMSYRPNAAFSRKTLEYCAARQDVDVSTFISTLFEKSDEHYMQNLGFVPGPGIRAAMQELAQSGGELSMVAQPASALDMKTVHLYKPSDWPDLFGLMVKVNGKEVSDLSFTLPNVRPARKEAPTATANRPELDPPVGQEQAAPVQAQTRKKARVARSSSGRPHYRIVKRGEVNKLVGRYVRISTTDGKRRSGLVLGIMNGVISLEMRMHGGTLSTEVPAAAASKIEVLERG